MFNWTALVDKVERMASIGPDRLLHELAVFVGRGASSA